MNNESIVRLIFSFLGGGVVAAILNWIRTNRAEKREGKIGFLDSQIRKLYGPLYYFVSQSEKLFELNKRIMNAYNKEFIGKKFSEDPGTQETVGKRIKETIGIANSYIDEVEKNNEKIKEILDNNYSYIDREDIDVFIKFYEHHIRLQKERDEEKRVKTPFPIYQEVGDISFLRPEFINRVKEKFLKKKAELDKLIK